MTAFSLWKSQAVWKLFSDVQTHACIFLCLPYLENQEVNEDNNNNKDLNAFYKVFLLPDAMQICVCLEGLFSWTPWTIHYRVLPGRDRGKPYFPAPSIIKTRPKPYEPRTTQTIFLSQRNATLLYTFPFLSETAQGPRWGILAAGHTRL